MDCSSIYYYYYYLSSSSSLLLQAGNPLSESLEPEMCVLKFRVVPILEKKGSAPVKWQRGLGLQSVTKYMNIYAVKCMNIYIH